MRLFLVLLSLVCTFDVQSFINLENSNAIYLHIYDSVTEINVRITKEKQIGMKIVSWEIILAFLVGQFVVGLIHCVGSVINYIILFYMSSLIRKINKKKVNIG